MNCDQSVKYLAVLELASVMRCYYAVDCLKKEYGRYEKYGVLCSCTLYAP